VLLRNLFEKYVILRSTSLLLLAFLFLILFFFSKPYLQGDEQRYLNFSENILNGYYANPDQKPGFLWNGPGYPILISPLKFLELPYVFYRSLNVIFIYLGFYFCYQFLLNFLKPSSALFVSLLGTISHPYIIDSISRILTESLSFFLVNFFAYTLTKFLNSDKTKFFYFGIIASGLLILTKVFFAYVFLVVAIIALGLFLIRKINFKYPLIFFAPFLFCLPYLIYTYSLTGKYFYWSDSGGSSLYSMSTPYDKEYGDWFSPNIDPILKKIRYSKEGSRTTIPRNNPPYFQKHFPFLNSIKDKNGVERDQLLKEKALENIYNYPFKYLKNVGSNISRIFIRTPFTDRELKNNYKIIFFPHGIIIFLGYLFSIIATFIFKNSNQIFMLSLFTFTALAGISLLSAESRFLFPIYGIFTSLIFIQLKNLKTWLNQKKYQL